MKKIIKITISLIVVFLVFGAAGFVIWAESARGPGEAALAALRSDAQVTVIDQGNYITFEPSGMAATTGFVFYPGGRVEYRAYAPILHKIAAQGFFVALVPVRLNLAFFDINAAEPVLKDHPAIKNWAVGGHSLGGVAAAIFAQRHPEIRGVVFWASYPADDKLKNTGVRMVSIYGTRDGLSTGEKIDVSKALMPADAVFVAIDGGNHAQFADYGPQPGDNPASISSESQWQQAADISSSFLTSLAP